MPPIFVIYQSMKDLGTKILADCAVQQGMWAGMSEWVLYGIPFTVILQAATLGEGAPGTQWIRGARDLMEGTGQKPWADFWRRGDYEV